MEELSFRNSHRALGGLGLEFRPPSIATFSSLCLSPQKFWLDLLLLCLSIQDMDLFDVANRSVLDHHFPRWCRGTLDLPSCSTQESPMTKRS